MHAEAIGTTMTCEDATPRKGLPRWFDATVALVMLIAGAPIMLVASLAIAVSSGRPIIFRQRRVGLNGEAFELCKFRTMRVGAAGLQITARKDARITGIGRFLRETKLDELPTFWNVLRGDMTLVGPRPEVGRFVDLNNPVWRRILAVRPGLTDPVTLQLRNEGSLLEQVPDKEEYYLDKLQPAKLKGYDAYLKERDWRSDLSVLLKTIWAIVAGRKSSPPAIHDIARGAETR